MKPPEGSRTPSRRQPRAGRPQRSGAANPRHPDRSTHPRGGESGRARLGAQLDLGRGLGGGGAALHVDEEGGDDEGAEGGDEEGADGGGGGGADGEARGGRGGHGVSLSRSRAPCLLSRPPTCGQGVPADLTGSPEKSRTARNYDAFPAAVLQLDPEVPPRLPVGGARLVEA